MSTKEAVCVGVRLRPFVAYEKGQKQCLTIRDNVVSVVGEVVGREARDFAFDYAMDSTDPSNSNFVDQEKCYDLMSRRMVEHIIQGYNTCLFCYGQTGTGKTTTIMGEVEPVAKQGLLLRLLHDLFEQGAKLQDEGCTMHFRVQMLEVYNDKIRDLLMPADTDSRKPPEVHLHPQHGVYVRGMTEDVVESFHQCVKLIDYGNTMKTVAATAMNSKSSRGHTIFKLMLEKRGGSDKTIITSEAFFVDLAGRENEKTTQVSGQRFAELTFINRSLLWLSICIQALGDQSSGLGAARRRATVQEGGELRRRSTKELPGSDLDGAGAAEGTSRGGLLASPLSSKRKTASVAFKDAQPAPKKATAEASASSRFRNSKLTLLLYNALNGNSKTAMIGTLSPAAANFEESLSTLKFASTVRSVKVEAKQATEVDKDSLVKALQEELRALKQQMTYVNEAGAKDVIESRMEWAQELYEHHKKRWEDEQNETKEMMAKREEALEKLGIARWNLTAMKTRAVFVGNPRHLEASLPCLLNYSDDPHLSGRFVLQPYIESREYSIGYAEACDFKLPRGLGISPRICFIRRQGLRMWIRPAADISKDGEVTKDSSGEVVLARVEVNGSRIFSEVELQHHDCVVLGRSLMLYTFSKADGGIHGIPADKLPYAHQDGKDSNETLIKTILGSDRSTHAEQLQLARNYLRHLQGQNMDYDGSQSIREFLLMSREASRMVEEANAITAELKPNSGLSFELTSMSPVLSFGYGRSSCPELCVRLVRNVSAAEAIRRMCVGRARRQSVHADLLLLDSFTRNGRSESMEPEEAGLEVLYTWTFAKFTERLALMHDARAAWAEDPNNFDLDPISDPWSEYGPSEIADLHQEHREKLESSHEEIERLRQDMQNMAAAGAVAAAPSAAVGHFAPRQVLPCAVQAAPQQPWSMVKGPLVAVADATAVEVHRLRESTCRLEMENSKLKAQLFALEARLRAAQVPSLQLSAVRRVVQAPALAANGACMALPVSASATPRVSPPSGHCSPRRGADGGSPLLLSILDLSKTNLLLVLELFDDLSRLSNAMLHASAACLQAPCESDPNVQAARRSLAAAAEDMAAFFDATGPLTQHAAAAADGQAPEAAVAWPRSPASASHTPGPASPARVHAALLKPGQLPTQHRVQHPCMQQKYYPPANDPPTVQPGPLVGAAPVASPRAHSSPPSRHPAPLVLRATMPPR